MKGRSPPREAQHVQLLLASLASPVVPRDTAANAVAIQTYDAALKRAVDAGDAAHAQLLREADAAFRISRSAEVAFGRNTPQRSLRIKRRRDRYLRARHRGLDEYPRRARSTQMTRDDPRARLNASQTPRATPHRRRARCHPGPTQRKRWASLPSASQPAGFVFALGGASPQGPFSPPIPAVK